MSITLINYNNRDQLKSVKTMIDIIDDKYNFIVQLLDKLINDSLDSYRYGTSRMDIYITDYRIQKLNRLINKYNIKIIK